MSQGHRLRAWMQELLDAEVGTLYREAPVRVSLIYPSPYRAGMSSLGYQMLYRVINERPDTVAERAFLPDDIAAWRSSRMPLLTFEQGRPVGDANLVAFSLAYELELPGLIECLQLSGLEPRACDRSASDPLVVVGGPLTFSNPLPVGPLADVVVMGEGEEVIHTVLDLLQESANKDDLLDRLAEVAGCWVPARHGERLLPVVAVDNARLPAWSVIRTPHTELSNMHLVEAERGCHRKCTFCVMRRSTNGGMRLASPESILGSIPEDATRVGLVGAAVSDHPRLIPIVEGIVESGREVGLSSLRADRLSDTLVELLKRGGYRTLTVASDGASERLRIAMQKVIREEHLLRAAEFSARHQMRLLKIYMMVGVPGETREDLDELVLFAREASRITPIALGIAPFVSKRNTPMDRLPFAGIREVEQTLQLLRRALRGYRVDLRATSARWAWVEHALAQGGFDMTEAALEAHAEGGGFSAWKKAIRRHQREEQPRDEALRLGRPSGAFADEGRPGLFTMEA